MNSYALLLVTQSHQIHVCLLPPTVTSLKILKAPLTQPTMVSEAGPQYSEDPQNTWGRRLCISAAIGLSYGGTLYIASHEEILMMSVFQKTRW